jgi:hypothetical protein
MTEPARREWLTVAWGTLRGIPADLLEQGCAHARKIADHPAKIVPAIMLEVDAQWEGRKRQACSHRPEPEQLPPPMENVCTPEEAQTIMTEMGIPPAAEERITRTLGPLRKPTRADYLAMGVDPSVLDSLESGVN